MQSLIIPFNHLILLKDEECVSFYKKIMQLSLLLSSFLQKIYADKICIVYLKTPLMTQHLNVTKVA